MARSAAAGTKIKSPKAAQAADCQTLAQLPNVGPAMVRDLQLLGIHHPADLVGRDAFQLYRELQHRTGQRQDPCVLDTFVAIVDFMNGAPPRPWWHYTAERRRVHGPLLAHAA